MKENTIKRSKKLIIVPAYNEVASINNVVSELNRILINYDILVIDDGSTDRTIDAVPKCAFTLRLPFNLGIGGTMQTGYRYAAMNGYDIAVQVDGDGQHLPCEVEKIVNHLKENDLDMVVGSRFLEQGNYKQSIDRLFGIILLRCILYLLTGGKVITDCTSGFRAVNSNVIHAFSQWYPEDYPEPEVIFLLLRSGFKVDEVPVKMTHRKGGKTSIPLINGLFYIIKVATALILDMFRDPWHNSSYDQ